MPRKPTENLVNFNLTDFSAFGALDIPDPITFVLGDQWLAQDRLYPRQATLLKIIFLRDDLFTDYDHQVIDEWESSFGRTGSKGISPEIRKRIKINKAKGRKWFREVLLVVGRRGGKGHVAGLAMSYILWNILAYGDPQEHYRIAPTKKIECLIYAGKKLQARQNLYGDLVAAIADGPCFGPYIHRNLGESLSIFAPADKLKMASRAKRGVEEGLDPATFLIQPKEATLMSGRGGASIMIGFDEMAHVVNAGANRSAEEIYGAATPSLDQFRPDDFIVEPSSPYQQAGQFYKNWEQAIEIDEDGEPVFPSKFMIQLPSWDIYEDFPLAHTLDVFPAGFTGDLREYEDIPLPKFPFLDRAYQAYDEDMKELERSNPEQFRVERLSQWAATMDSYLDEEKIKAMFDPNLEMTTKGRLNQFYKSHADPSTSNANFGLSVAHLEDHPTQPGFKICVFDYIHHWDPADFEDHTIDYVRVVDEIWDLIAGYPIDVFTTDQFSSGPIRSMLMDKKRKHGRILHKDPLISEVTATAKVNWRKAENFKTALNQGWIKAPYYEQAEMELRFLRLVATATTMRVDKQDTGPCTTKDVADTMFECVHALLGDQIQALIAGLTDQPMLGSLQGGITPFGQTVADKDQRVFEQLGGRGGAGRYRGQSGFGGSIDPSRGIRRSDFGPSRRGR